MVGHVLLFPDQLQEVLAIHLEHPAFTLAKLHPFLAGFLAKQTADILRAEQTHPSHLTAVAR
eukprot:scaffold651477_cov47-Prasinocladus_malaysianus.AAC.1